MKDFKNRHPAGLQISGVKMDAMFDITDECKKELAPNTKIVLLYGRFERQRRIYIASTNTRYRRIRIHVYYLIHGLKNEVGNERGTFGTWASTCGFSEKELYDMIMTNRPKGY